MSLRSMWELFLDASTSRPFLCLIKEKSIFYFEEQNERGSKSLITGLQALLKRCPIAPKELAQIYVGSGPGSFIGLRSALTIAKMFRVSFQTPIVMLPVMGAISLPSDGKIASLIDGKSKGIYVATHEKRGDELFLLEPPKLVTIEEAQKIGSTYQLCSFEKEILEKKLNRSIKIGSWNPHLLLELIQNFHEEKEINYTLSAYSLTSA